MNALDLARVCHVDLSLAQAWIDGQEQPSDAVVGRLRLVQTVMDGLSRNGLGEPEERVEWLRNPNRAFGYEAPIDLLARGEPQAGARLHRTPVLTADGETRQERHRRRDRVEDAEQEPEAEGGDEHDGRDAAAGPPLAPRAARRAPPRRTGRRSPSSPGRASRPGSSADLPA